MEVRVVDNVSRNMVSVLSPAIEHSKDIRVAVAFISQPGLDLLWNSVETALRGGAYLEFLIGLDMRITEPDALKKLYDLSRASNNVSLICYSKANRTGIYHPKLYLLKNDDDTVTSVVGSSNLTKAGLQHSMEINVIIKGNVLDDAISDSYEIYDRLKFHENRIEPDDEYLEFYKELRSHGKKVQGTLSKDPVFRELQAKFNEKTKSLRRPTLTNRDMIGWRKLIYEALPDDEFTNSKIYEYEQSFKERYPGNSNIKDKIRQQLQVLAKRGKIEHIGRGRWRKL